MHGMGRIEYDDGSFYEGSLVNNKMDGKNCRFYFSKEKKMFLGQFKENKIQGTGTMVYQDGQRYDGNFVNGYRHGPGILIYSFQDKFVGTFEKDEIEG